MTGPSGLEAERMVEQEVERELDDVLFLRPKFHRSPVESTGL